MKTKEELAQEYADECYEIKFRPSINEAFISGYEAQSFEDKLIYSNQVIKSAEEHICKLREKLEKAVDALEFYKERDNVMPIEISPAKEALKAIKGE